MARKLTDTSLSLLINDGINLHNRSIDLFGEVDEMMSEKLIRGVNLLLEKDPVAPINLHINSYGGDAYDGLFMFDFIRSLENVEVNTFACGKVFSAAMFPFIAGDIRGAYDNSRFMLHSASSYTKGKAFEISTDSKEIESINQRFCEILSDYTNIDAKKWAKLIRYEDLYLDKTEAIKYNIVNKKDILK